MSRFRKGKKAWNRFTKNLIDGVPSSHKTIVLASRYAKFHNHRLDTWINEIEREFGTDDDQAWMCYCGHYEESGLHCSKCGNEPPWGCDCSFCNEPPDDDDYDDLDYDEDF